MKRFLNFEKCRVSGGAVHFFSDDKKRFVLTGDRKEVCLCIQNLPDLNHMKRLVVHLQNNQPTNESLFIRFLSSQDDKSMEMNVALFPYIKAVAVFELSNLDGQLHFPPLTPGTLKSHVVGDGMNPKDVNSFQIGLGKGYQSDRSLEVFKVYLTDEDVDFPDTEYKTVDKYGQWTQKDWNGKIHSEQELSNELMNELLKYQGKRVDSFDQYGGWKGIHYEPTGYFSVKKDKNRWFLLDPEGNLFFSIGVFGVYPGEPGWIRGVEKHFEWLPDECGEFSDAFNKARDMELFRRKFSGMFPNDTSLYSPAIANMIRVFGREWYEKWACLTTMRLHSWGINTLSIFSDPQYVKKARMPYVIMLNHFPVTNHTIFREFPDVFSPEYDEKSRAFAEQLKPYADDSFLIGYFLNNEPTWGFIPDLNLAEKLLEMGIHSYSLDALIDFLFQRYHQIDKLNEAWRLSLNSFNDLRSPIKNVAQRSDKSLMDLREFTGIMLDMYAGIPSKYTQEADSNHLNLGMRFAAINNDSLLRTSRHFNVFSFNCYQATPTAIIESLESRIDKPLLVGEFHFGALDAGLPSPSLFCVDSQKSRGDAYTRYIQSAAKSKNTIGVHYFAYNDQPLWGRYDGENYQFGFVDICNLPYRDFVMRVAATNNSLYDVITGKAEPLEGTTERV